MPVDVQDAAYWFVQEANVKEARNAAKRAAAVRRWSNPHPLFYVCTATILFMIAHMNFKDGQTYGVVVFLGLGLFHLWISFDQWRKRKEGKVGSPR